MCSMPKVAQGNVVVVLLVLQQVHDNLMMPWQSTAGERLCDQQKRMPTSECKW